MMSDEKKSKALGRFKTEFIRLEDSQEHTLTHESACNLVNEAKKEFQQVLYSGESVSQKVLFIYHKWFGE